MHRLALAHNGKTTRRGETASGVVASQRNCLNADVQKVRRPVGVTLLVAFFLFGVAMCGLTTFLLLFPGTPGDAVWQLKPGARDEFMRMRSLGIVTMLATGTACALAAVGLGVGREWGRFIAIAVLAINVIGDATNAFVRHDWRTLIGLPIGGAMIAYLFSAGVKRWTARGAL
ncbi:MAG: hypothetical protein ACJ8HU_05450 [Chthoniobacterales bacterium]